MTDALVTVGVPVHQGDEFLAGALESILAQDLTRLEVVVADNASTDRTLDIAREFADVDRRVRILRSGVNRGATWNYNRLLESATTPYFKWAAHDDLLAPDHLRRCVAELERSPGAVIAYPRTVLIDGSGHWTDPHFVDGLDLRDPDPVRRFQRYLAHDGEQHAVFGVARTEALRRAGGIANCWGGDQVLLAQLLLQGEIHEVPRRAFFRRYHDRSSMVANRTPIEVARWFDPSVRGLVAMPRSRLTIELLRAVAGADLKASTRARLTAAIGRIWLPRFARVIGGEVKLAVRAQLAP